MSFSTIAVSLISHAMDFVEESANQNAIDDRTSKKKQ